MSLELLRDGLRMLGYKSEVLSFNEHRFRYGADIFYRSDGQFLKKISIMYNFIKMSFKYNAFHFHAHSLHPTSFDLIFWKLLGKKIIMHYHGSEIRNKKQKVFQRYFADIYIVSTPDLLAFVPNSIWLPNPIDTRKFPLVEPNLKNHKLRYFMHLASGA